MAASPIENRLRVPAEHLTTRIDASQLGLTGTRDAPALEGTVGQDRALRALEFGLGVRAPGFNVFVAGAPGSGRNSTIASYLERTASALPTPSDWAYVHNFDDPQRPNALRLPAGMARRLHADVEVMVAEARTRIPSAFEGEEYEQRVREGLRDIQNRHRQATADMTQEAQRHGVGLAITNAGVVATPLGPDGQPLEPEEFEKLPTEERERMRTAHEALSAYVNRRLGELHQLDKEATARRSDIDREVAGFVLRPLFEEIRQTYADELEVLDYFDEVYEDMLRSLGQFRHAAQAEPPAQLPPELSQGLQGREEERWLRYQVNLYVDNGRATGAPVVFENSPLYYNLFGRVEHELRMGALRTDFTMVRAGSLARANGGFLVLQAKDVLANPLVWQTLKQALRSAQVRPENLAEQFSSLPAATIDPESIPLDTKVVLVGNMLMARMLLMYDEDFAKLFKVRADFEATMALTGDNVRLHASFIAHHTGQGLGLLHFDAPAIARLAEHSSRLAGDQRKLTTRFQQLVDLATEASYWAAQAGREMVGPADIEQAIAERGYRNRMVEDRLQELYDEGTLRVEVTGFAVGQINGLAVIDMGDYAFGRPSRLTATVALGRGQFSTVDQEAQLSGPIHNKGFQILVGYLASRFGADAAMPVRASIAFEQTYDQVEGDSASSTQLYALLSALSGTPLRQEIAVTGSVDQQGHVQAVGGVTEKVEGFYDVCASRGLTGTQGVMMPAANVPNLVLRRDVVDAIEAGRFHVYAVAEIDDGIELLTGVPSGKPDAAGAYPDDSIHAKVSANLGRMAERLREPERVEVRHEIAPAATEKERPAKEPDPREGDGGPPAPPPA